MKLSTLVGMFFLCVIIVVNIVAAVYVNEIVNTYHDITDKQISAITSSRSSVIEKFFDSQLDFARNLSNSSIVKDYLKEVGEYGLGGDLKYAEEILRLSVKEENLEYNENIYIVDENDTVVLSNIKNVMGQKTDIRLGDYIKNADKAGVSRVVSDKYINHGSKSVMIYTPIVLDDGTKYYYYKAMDRDCLSSKLVDLNMYDKGFICLADETGATLPGVSFDTLQDLDILCKGFETFLSTDSSIIAKSIREDGKFAYKNNKVAHVAYYTRITNADMTYVISVPENILYKTDEGIMTRFTLVIIIVAILFIVAILYLIHRVLSKPMTEITNVINKVLKNNNYERILKGNTFHEIAQLSGGVNRLISKFRTEITELSSFRDRYRIISENSRDITFEWNFKKGSISYSDEWNKRFSGAHPKPDMLTETFVNLDYVHPNDIEIVEKSISIMKAGNDTQIEFRIKDMSRMYRWVLARTTSAEDSDGGSNKIVGIMIDINKLKTLQEEYMNKSMYDRLTGLYNMESFEFKIADELEMCKNSQTEMGVVFIDIDDFKHFNDEYGHEVGNEVLKYVANTLSEIATPNNGFAGRFGGDEFLMCIKGMDIEKKIVALATQFLEGVYELDSELLNKKLSISCSVGIALYPRDAKDADELLKKSDTAMYNIKRDGKNGVVLFNENMREE